MSMQSNELPFYLVIGFAALPAAIGLCAVFAYNAKTAWIVRRIQHLYQSQGSKWPFWTNMDRIIAFALTPESFLREAPSLAYEDKMQLIGHRRAMKQYMIRTLSFMFASFGVAIALLLLIVWMRK